jgi:protein-S-isoprenylcysteine O-methyltransferase
MVTYAYIILFSWLTFFLIWTVGSFSVKRDIRGGRASSLFARSWPLRTGLIILGIFAAARILTDTARYTNRSLFSTNNFFAPSALQGWIAALLTVLGIAFAIWARIHLGKNWSSSPAVKEGHELVTSGPYRYVRHPIYTGLLVAAFGTALTGTYFGLDVFFVYLILIFSRLNKEEKIMLELFPGQYPAYQTRTKRLIPFVW